MLNLKDLLTVLPTRLEGLLENELVLEASFCAESNQILPFSAKNTQIMAENRGFSRSVLLEREASCGAYRALAGASWPLLRRQWIKK